MRRLFRLSFLALAVWTSWLGLLTLMIATWKASVWHPHYLPVTVLLGVFILAGGALVVGGLWRLAFGPRRLEATTYLLLGTAPLLFMTGYFLYGLRAGYGRLIDLNTHRRMLIPLGESLFDLEARLRYPLRTKGDTVVMISKSVANARDQVAAMDRHVRALRERLGGRTTPRRVHWVRGPLMGMQGKAIRGICLGSSPEETSSGADRLTYLDRHEVAHGVLSTFTTLNIDPPALLVEGWAEANSGLDEARLNIQAWETRRIGRSHSLRELTGPEWYHCHESPVYCQGALLVNHILRTHGPDRFLELYTTCRQATFPDDCRRALGQSLDELDHAYWADIERAVGRQGDLAAWLKRVKVKAPVEPSTWKAFLDEYLAEAAHLVAPYEHAQVIGESRFTSKNEGEPETSTVWFKYRRSGVNRSLVSRFPDSEVVQLATPVQSFEARRSGKNAPWEVDSAPHSNPADVYRRIRFAIETSDPFSKLSVTFRDMVEGLQGRVDTSHIVVTKLERFVEGDHRFVRVRLENESPGNEMPWRAVTSVMDADHHLAARSDVVDLSDGATLRTDHEYEICARLPIIRASQLTVVGNKGVQREAKTTILEHRFGPIPDAEFTLERLLDGPVIQKPVDTDHLKDAATFTDWYHVPLILGFLSLVGGVGLQIVSRSRRRL